jgi:hypothetical protein
VTLETFILARAPADTVSTTWFGPAERRSGMMIPSTPGAFGAADDGPEVLGVLDLIQGDEERAFGRL